MYSIARLYHLASYRALQVVRVVRRSWRLCQATFKRRRAVEIKHGRIAMRFGQVSGNVMLSVCFAVAASVVRCWCRLVTAHGRGMRPLDISFRSTSDSRAARQHVAIHLQVTRAKVWCKWY